MCHRYDMISFTTTQRNFESPRSPIQNRRSSRKLDTSLDYSRGSRMEFRDCQAWKSGLRKSAILIYLIIICSPFSLHCSHFPKSPQRDHTVFLFLPECFYRRISIFKEFLERSCVSFLFFFFFFSFSWKRDHAILLLAFLHGRCDPRREPLTSPPPPRHRR